MMSTTALMLTIIGMGLITFFLRFSLIALADRITIQTLVKRGLVYVPTAVLSAIVFPDMFARQGQLDLSLTNEHMISGLLAMVAAWYSKNVFTTMLVGMGALWLLQWLGV